MAIERRKAPIWLMATAVMGMGLIATPMARAQRATVAKTDAELMVDGVVREVFKSARQGQVDYLVQIEVRQSTLKANRAIPPASMNLAPGDVVYVHVYQRPAGEEGFASESYRAVPGERSQIRAYLVLRKRGGGLEGTFPDWFELTSNSLAPESRADPAPPADGEPIPTTTPGSLPVGRSVLDVLGITADPLKVGERFVLNVTGVNEPGPAKAAGIEVGDVIVEANGAAFTSLEQLGDSLRKGGREAILTVRDVNSGRSAKVTVTLAGNLEPNPKPGPAPTTPPVENPQRQGDSAKIVGLSGTRIRQQDGRRGFKVSKVEPDGPAGQAGIEVGDVIVAANGLSVDSAEALTTAASKGGPELKLTVRDSRTGREVVVPVTIAASVGSTKPVEPPAGSPRPKPQPEEAGQKNALGVTTVLTIFGSEAAIKVTKVEPGSPAEKAGIEVGDVITEANGTPILHPDALADAVRKAGSSLKLVIGDARSGKTTKVDVKIGE